MVSDQGIGFVLDLPETLHLRDGDGLVLGDGRIVEVRAAREELCEIRGTDSEHLLRLAWHIGNRHLAAQLVGGRILIRRDRVIEDMLHRLGAFLRDVDETFEPEGGAYRHGPDSHHHET
jgi:urease accessory protein